MKNHFLILILSCISLFSCRSVKEEQWQSLFNGKDLSGWDIKISGYDLNDNYNDTFIVKDSSIYVNYTNYKSFGHEFGHLFYKVPFSSYKLQLEYRIFGSPVPGTPGYAFANSGVMLHSQSAQSMEINQNFPISIEMQFLARLDSTARATGNLASPGTHVVVNNKLHTDHMLYAKGKTFGAEWVHAEAIVYGDSIVHHVINGDTVLSYQKPQIGGWEKSSEKGWIENKDFVTKMLGTPLKSGYIALQAEGHPVQFKNLRILDLSMK